MTPISATSGIGAFRPTPDSATPLRLAETAGQAPSAGTEGVNGSETQRSVAQATAAPESGDSRTGDELTKEERAAVEKLKARDHEVRAHEQAHARVGGQYAGQPTYEYQTGPDGRQYAVGGQVSIDVSPVSGDPEATIEKMRIVKAAALAPAEPSSQDRRVAAIADQQRLEAQAELLKLRSEERLAQAGGGDAAGDDLLSQAREGYREADQAVGPTQQPEAPIFSLAA